MTDAETINALINELDYPLNEELNEHWANLIEEGPRAGIPLNFEDE